MECRSKSMAVGNNNRRNHYGVEVVVVVVVLLLAVGVAVLISVVILQKMKDGRVFGLLLQEREEQLLALQLLLQKEKEMGKETERKLEDLEAKAHFLKDERTELTSKLTESEDTITQLQKKQEEIETTLEDKQNQIKQLEEQAAESTTLQLSAPEMKQETQAAQSFQDGKLENSTIYNDDRKSNETDSNQDDIVNGEKWVKFETNLEKKSSSPNDEIEGYQSSDLVSEHNPSEKLEVSADGVGKVSQKREPEVKEHEEKSTNADFVYSSADNQGPETARELQH